MVAIITGNGTGLERSSAWVLGSRGQLGSAGLGRDGEDIYVNAANGNLVITRQDEFLIGNGGAVSIDRTYNSKATAGDGDNGDKWQMSGYRRIIGATTDAAVTRVDWDGSETVYYGGSGSWICKEGPGAYDTLIYSSGQWIWTDGTTQAKEFYDGPSGRLVSARDTDGIITTYAYNGSGQLSRVTNTNDEAGQNNYADDYTDFTYSGTLLTQLVTAKGGGGSLTRVRYAYDGSNRLSTVTVDLSPDDSSVTDAKTYVTSYAYDGTSNRVASISQQDGSYVAFGYVQSGSDYKVAVCTQTVASGVTRSTFFDYASGRTIVTDPAGQKTTLYYDGNGQLLRIGYPPDSPNATPKSVQFVYNGNGDVTSAALGPGNVITYTYDTSGNPLSDRDSAGNTVTRTYGSKNELLTETHYLVPDPDGPFSQQPATPVVTRYAYDVENHLRFVISPEGRVTEHRYDTPGRRTVTIEHNGALYTNASVFDHDTLVAWAGNISDKAAALRSQISYDYRGGVATVTSYSKLLSSGEFDTSSELSQTTYVYDQAGNLLSRIVSGSSACETFVYDGLGRMTQATDFNGGVTKTVFLDALGQTVLTHANGLSEVSTYNKAGELIAFSKSEAGANLVDLTGWPSDPGNLPAGYASVPGWINNLSVNDETRWANTIGPDGIPVAAIQAGQQDTGDEGGGGFTNQVTIDGSKAYEFTLYFKISDLDKHTVYFGMSAWGATAWVENAAGVDDINPYFFYAPAGTQAATYTANKWYKVVGYVLPQGTAFPATPLGGVYDAQTGAKVADVNNTYRWNAERPDNSVHLRFFDFYGAANQVYSTYFYQPEIRQVSTATAIGPDMATSLYRYDSLGRLRMTIDPTGRRNYMMYDSVGRKVADIDADGSVIEYRYDGSDNLTSTTRYRTGIDVGALIDINGKPTTNSFASLRPTPHADDQWTFQFYDAAQRLIQTTDGTGATTVYSYDGASRLTSTKTYANRLSAATLAALKAEANNTNLWANADNGAWAYYNLSQAAASPIDGASAYQFTVQASSWEAVVSNGLASLAGDIVSVTLSMKAVGTTTTNSLGLYGTTTGWGYDYSKPDAYGTIVSGPGTFVQYGSHFYIEGLSTTEATRITITRTLPAAETAAAYLYVRTGATFEGAAGASTILSAPVMSRLHAGPYYLPTADASNDRVSRNFYDNDGRLVAAMDAAGGLTQFTYDKTGRKVLEFGFAKAVAPSLRATGSLWDMLNSLTQSASDRASAYVYDARGYLRYTIDASGHPTGYTYDGAGRIIRTTDYAGWIAGAASYPLSYVESQLASTGLNTNSYNRISRSVYDAAGQLMFAIDATGAVAAFGYDSVGRVIKQTRYWTAYTAAGDPSVATMQSWASANAAAGYDRIDRTVYDLFGRVAFTVDAEGYVSEHQYDRAGRAAKDTRYAAAYSVSDGVTRESLAALVAPAAVSARVNVSYAYDADGRLSDVTQDLTDTLVTVTHTVYDTLGQATDVTVAYGSADASTTHYTYDAAGRVLTETRGFGSAVAATTTNSWDAVGNLLTTQFGDYTTRMTYDAAGRVLTVTVPVDTSSANDLVTTNEYDAFGSLVRAQDAKGVSKFLYYNSLGQMTLEVDREGYATQTYYTVFGEVASVVRYAARTTGTPTVTAAPTIVTGSGDATTTFAYDKLSRLLSVTDAQGFVEYYYLNPFGDRQHVFNKTGGHSEYVHDRLGRRTYEYVWGKAYRPDGTVQAENYFIASLLNYDSRGNVIRKTEALGLTEQRQTDYFYDKANRLVTVVYPYVAAVGTDLVTLTGTYPQESYVYNLRGDCIRHADPVGATTFTYYDALGRKTDEVSPVGTLSHWSYDGNGNLQTARVYGDPVALPTGPAYALPSPANANNYRQTVYGYDGAHRLITTTVAGLMSGAFIGSSYSTTASGDVVTQAYYDKNGNVWAAVDGAGNVTWTWYDALNRKIAQIDAENYLTCWTLDANGNATAETRYATRITGSFSGSTAASALPALAGTSAADRTTNFTYDKNGRRLTETRLGVVAATVSGLSVSTSTVSATVTYTYNGLGQVLTKTEANGDLTQYEYDSLGRLTTTRGAAFVDHMGSWIRPVTELRYDGLGNLVRTMAHGDTNSYTPDRITTNSYDAGGRLASTTDANGFVRSYGYDAAGRVVKESWSRLKSDGTTSVTEAIGYRYDLAGRLVTQAAATQSGASFVFGDATRIQYNAYGEMSGRGLTAGPDAAAVYQELFFYDAGGRMWKSSGGDGTLKFLFYDKAGRATLTLSSTGANLWGLTQGDAFGSLTAAGGTTIANAVTSIAVYDKRGLQIQSREPDRQLTSSTSQTIVTSSAYNAFGETLSETDARGYTTDYSYNAMGRLIEKKSPTVDWTSESGAVAAARPTETYYYDVSGRLVGVRDANNSLTTRVLENGTGHDGKDALVHSEYHSDGGVATIWHNVFFDERVLVNELGQWEVRGYDNMGRVTEVDHRGGLLNDYYVYDGLGRQIRHTNSLLGSGNVERTDYDVQGRVVSQIAFGGDTTTHVYTWYSYLSSGDLGAFGAWEDITTYANGKNTIEDKDYFGRTVWRRDMGLNIYTFTLDRAGRTTSQTVGGETLSFTYFNTGLTASLSSAGGANQTLYGYDAAGNEISEKTWKASLLVQDATASFDALNRMTGWNEAGNGTLTSGSPPASMTWQYDLAGNIRRSTAGYRSLDGAGTANGAAFTQDYWYAYDNMNRVTVEKGVLSGGAITIMNGAGILYGYDAAGRRATSTRIKDASYTVVVNESTGSTITRHHAINNVETYVYNGDGTMGEVRIAEDTFEAETGYVVGVQKLKSSSSYDAMGRQTHQVDWLGDGTNQAYDRTITYNASGQVYRETTITKQWNSNFTSLDYYSNDTYNYYGSGSGYDLGSVEHSVTTNKKGSTLQSMTTQSTITTTNAYTWRDGPAQTSINVVTDYVSGTDTNYTTTLSYTAAGHLTSSYIGDGRPRTVTFTTDMAGQVIRRDEADNNSSGGDPHEIWYRYGGRQLGYTGNNGTLETDYLTSIDNRTRTPPSNPAAFMFGASAATPYADFNQALAPVTSYAQGSDAGSYTVRAGETLESIAQNLWGDSSLWYQLASANGLSSPGAPGAGRTLAIPANVMSNAHNASTFRPYDPARAIGDLSPTNPKPAKKGGCGMIGAILMVVIAVAVTALTAGAAVAALGPATGVISGLTALGAGTTTLGAAAVVGIGAAAGALGSIASQGFGIAIGQQSKFNWKGVGLAAIAGGIGAGMGPSGFFGTNGAFGGVGNGVVAGVLRSAVSSALTQGIGVATGLQKKFDFAGVAGAALGGGISGAIGNRFSALGAFGGNLANNAVGGLANAAAHSLIDGTDFGDNVMAALPDIIGSTIGNFISEKITSAGEKAELKRIFKESSATKEGSAVIRLLSAGTQSSMSPAEIVARLRSGTEGRSPQEAMRIIAGNVRRTLADARDDYPDAYNAALSQNSAIVTLYSALALQIPNFRWFAMAAFAAHQIRGQYHTIQQSLTPTGRPVMSRFTLGESGVAIQLTLRDSLLNTVADYQRMVAVDVIPIGLGYAMYGGDRIAPFVPSVLRGAMQSLAQADRTRDARQASILRTDAAIATVTWEQGRLQRMWDGFLIGNSTRALDMLGMLDTSVHIGLYPNVGAGDPTRIGTIYPADLRNRNLPPGTRLLGRDYLDVTDLDDRRWMARRSFQWMHDTVYSNTSNIQRMNVILRGLLDPSNHVLPRHR